MYDTTYRWGLKNYNKLVNIREKKQTHRYGEQTSASNTVCKRAGKEQFICPRTPECIVCGMVTHGTLHSSKMKMIFLSVPQHG